MGSREGRPEHPKNLLRGDNAEGEAGDFRESGGTDPMRAVSNPWSRAHDSPDITGPLSVPRGGATRRLAPITKLAIDRYLVPGPLRHREDAGPPGWHPFRTTPPRRPRRQGQQRQLKDVAARALFNHVPPMVRHHE